MISPIIELTGTIGVVLCIVAVIAYARREVPARNRALTELARTNAELKQRLAERTIERDDVARDEALTELARTNAELKQRLAERTIERDDVARDEALTELARTNAELKQRLAERTIERDDVARDEALTELARTNAELKQRLAERTIERDDVARDEALTELARTNAAQEQLQHHLARHDPLTALPNRTLFYASLRDALAQAAKQQSIVSVLFLDIDHFKDINDTMGHACGDELLRQVGHRLGLRLRAGDTVGRLGGDEFAVVLLSADTSHGVEIVANKLRDALRQPFDLEGREATITASIGISMFPADSTDAENLLNYADTAMYAAKEAGRDTCCFYINEMNANQARRLDLEKALRRALDHDEFVLHYQPKIDLETRRWTGVEALLRWNRPGHGLVLPDEFIPLLEETGLILPVGIWVIDAACLQIAAWIAAGIGAIPIAAAVNVSVKQLLHGRRSRGGSFTGTPRLESAVACALRKHAVATNLLEIELTESALMLHTEETVELLRRLKSMGIHISIDDFGTGYSSLAYLKGFPVNAIKIDKTFIGDITTDPENAARIILAIINLAHSLKLRVVAEGVETREQLDFLCANGCDEAQGYYIALPMSADAIAQLFRSSGGHVSTTSSTSIPNIIDINAPTKGAPF